MKVYISFIFGMSFYISSCYPPCKGNFTQQFEMTLKVVDMDNNPVKNREVIMFTLPESHNPSMANLLSPVIFDKTSTTTDNIGNIKLAYILKTDCEMNFSRAFIVKEDSLFKAVDFVKHSVNINQKTAIDRIKLSDTIRMDSLVPFKMRIKSSKNNVSKLYMRVASSNLYGYSIDTLYRTFKYSFGEPISSQLIDTTIVTQVYSKRQFYMKNDIKLSDSSIIQGKPYFIDRNINRNVIFLYEIN